MEKVSLEEVIRRYIPLPPTPNSKGWYPVLCKVCMDHGRKGPRAAFNFDGDACGFHCFNCGPDMNTVYDPHKHRKMPAKMQTVLRDFGVPDDEWQKVVFSSLAERDSGDSNSVTPKQEISIEPKELDLPDTFYFLKDADENDKWGIIARDYLEHERGIDPNSYPFMLSKDTNDPRLKKWRGRVIIPIYKGDKLIYWQGRDLTDKAIKKYESPSSPKDCVMYGFDMLFEHTEMPLYIVEGWFDAYAIGGVGLLGNDITDAQIKWLNRSRRQKVYIPDRFGNGQVGAEEALRQGWHIATPDIGNCKDMSDAVKKYGKMYVMKSLVETTASGFAAKVALGVYCKDEKKEGGASKETKRSYSPKRR